ncbi:MAG: DUF11 domain-containing protein [Candidatus Kerfeldbacteria bacterium]|nr:DUF11 domain-containing protein [Candidatus Kerfeldbacteria bacterium]
MTINFIQKKTFRQKAWKTLNVFVGVATILNVSLVGALVAPKAAYADSIQYTLEGQRKDASFTTGNICSGGGRHCYAEGENVPFRLTITNLTPSTAYSVRIQHDFQDSPGRDGYVNFNTPGTWDGSATGVGLSAPTTSAGLPNTKTYDLTFTTASATTVVQLKWFGLLGQDAGEWSGAQLHARLVQGVQQESIGNKEVPIQVTKIVIRDLTVTKSDNPDPIQLNNTTTYTIVVTNSGEQDETVTVVDQLPTNLVYVNGSGNPAPSSVSGDSRTITWNGIVVTEETEDGGTRTLTFNARGVEVGTGTNAVSVTAPLLDPVSDTENTTVLGQCELTITKAVNQQTALPGDTLTYTINYANTGTANCTGGGARIDDVTPPNTTYVNGSNTQSVTNDTDAQGIDFGYDHAVFGSPNPAGYDPATKLLSWDGEVVSPGESGQVTYQVTVNQLPVCTTTNIDNTAKIYADQFPGGVTSNSVRTVVTTPCNGDLAVNKYFDDDGNGQIDRTNPQAWTWDLQGGSQDNPGGIPLSLPDGTYTVNEDPIPNYSSSWTCSNQTSGPGTSFSVSVLAGGAVTCSFTNTRETGTLRVIKTVMNDNGGTATASNFTMHIKQGGVDMVTPFPGSATGTDKILLTGTYQVNESGLPTGYTQTNIVCDGQATSSVTVVAGQTKTCTITNDDIQPKLTVTKRVVNDNGGNAGVSDFPLFVNATLVQSGVQNGFNADDYIISETNQSGYAATISGDCAANGSITLNPGDVKECTITNNDIAPTITLIKNVINNNGGDAGPNDFGLTIGGTAVSSGQPLPVAANTPVALNEAGLAGYNFVSLTGDTKCPQGLGGTVTLDEGEDITCTITNDDIAPTITLIKNVINNNGGNSGPNDFGLEIDGQTVNSSNPTPVDANTDIEINEAGLAGYEFVSITGDEGCPEELGDTVTLDEGENLTCTITNDDIQPRLVVTKIVINSNGSNASPSDFTMHVSGANASPDSFPGSDSGTLVTLDQGAYSVTEDSLDGFDPVFSSDCTGSINVGETKYCTVTNTAQTPHLLVIKTIVNDNGGNNVESDFTMNVTAGNPLPSSFPGNPGGTLVELDLGSYSVDETGPAGYAKTLSPDCAGTIALGQTKICEITNNDIAPQLTVIKHVVNDNGGTKVAGNFTMNVTGTNVQPAASFPGAEAPGTTVTLIQGAYGVDETPMAGYAKTLSGDCSGTISVGETKTCTITNDDVQPKLTVTKVVVNDNGGTKEVADFVLFVDFTPVTSGVQNGFNASSYVVSEAFIPGYSATISGDCAANGSITLSPGDVKSCTITNNDIQPKLTVTKVVVNDQGGSKQVSDFPLFVGAAPVTSGVQNGFNAGSYTVSETNQAGYVATFTGDCDSQGNVSLNLGDVKSCTVTNNDVRPVLGLQKSANPTTVPAGQDVTWTVSWSISGNANATAVVISDPIPASSTFVSVADGGVYNATTNTITWNLGSQAPGAFGEVHFVTRAASPIANGTVITNTATIDSAETDPAISASASVTVTSAPDLTIAKTSSVTTFTNPGQPVTYTVTVTNKATATDTAKNVVLTDTLPSGFTFAVDGSTAKSFTVGNLAPGQSATVTYLVNISGTQAAGTYNNSAKAKGDNTSEVTATAPVEVRVPIVLAAVSPELTIAKTVNKKSAKPGDILTYTITVKNVGDGGADNVVVSDTLPKDLSFVHGTGRTMTWEIGTLQAGRNRVINVDVRVESDAKKGDYENVAVVAANDVPPQEARTTITVTKPKVLGLATTGAGPLDLAIAVLGATLIGFGLIGLRRRQEQPLD